MLPGTHGWWFSQDAEIAQLHAKQAAEEAMALPFFYDLGGRLGAYLAGQKEGGKTHGPGCKRGSRKGDRSRRPSSGNFDSLLGKITIL